MINEMIYSCDSANIGCVLFFHFQLASLGSPLCAFNHRKFCVIALTSVIVLTIAVELNSFYILSDFFISFNIISAICYAIYAVMSGTHLIVSIMYVTLLLSAKVRFWKINEFLR